MTREQFIIHEVYKLLKGFQDDTEPGQIQVYSVLYGADESRTFTLDTFLPEEATNTQVIPLSPEYIAQAAKDFLEKTKDQIILIYYCPDDVTVSLDTLEDWEDPETFDAYKEYPNLYFTKD